MSSFVSKNHQLLSDRYQQLRSQFIAAVEPLQSQGLGQLTSIQHTELGPSGEPIFLDWAYFGKENAEQLIIVNSGTHGIEGYVGSRLQLQLLEQGVVEQLPDSVAVAMIHGVNPYGVAWHRRVDENNVDVNRNFIDFKSATPENSAYYKYLLALNPTTFENGLLELPKDAIHDYYVKQIDHHYFAAVIGGQYIYPEGLQYGGDEPSWSRQTLDMVWKKLIPGKTKVISLDIHTGLGNFAKGILMMTGQQQSDAVLFAKQCFGEVHATKPRKDRPLTGLLGPYLRQKFPEQLVIPLVMEFGTYSVAEVLRALQADNWLHHYAWLDSPTGYLIKQAMIEAFDVADADWVKQVSDRWGEVFDQALKGIQLEAAEKA